MTPEELAADPWTRSLLNAARSWGVSPRRFLGFEPETVTRYEYAADGRLVRSVTTTEPEWDEESRDLAFALLAYEADLCPGCKQPMAETTAPENEGRYVAALAIRCHRCTAAEAAGAKYESSPSPTALFIPLKLRDTDMGAPSETDR